jgi:hypothetical protein
MKMLVKLGKVTQDDIDEILAQFDILDGALRWIAMPLGRVPVSCNPDCALNNYSVMLVCHSCLN